ncbi:hypothetical protein [Moorena sp. SIO4G3]|uniref:hypothetical protein n=1 Tax=Moorena sp. SIO4G3 TaxID=2607821 RepID=UPI00142A7143|nr:hypothetical protein [Moorena sp. SIO4G3]NEO79488.1 hypothetical protein [Moorena sp. SIO4G3]
METFVLREWNQPGVDFEFYYGNERIINTIYKKDTIEDAVPIHLKLKNKSEKKIKFKAPEEQKVSENEYHILVKFPQGVMLDLRESEIESSGGWEVAYGVVKDSTSNAPFESIYFLKKEEQELEGRGVEGDNVVLPPLQKFCADPGYEDDSTNVELWYGPLLEYMKEEGTWCPLNPNNEGVPVYVSKTITVADPKGKGNIPLHVGFKGSNTILNDGKEQNQLTLRITNTGERGKLSFTDNEPFKVWFETGEEQEKPYALAEVEKVKGIRVEPADLRKWKANQETDGKWLISPEKISQGLSELEYIELEIKNIVTNHPTGKANLYLEYGG